MSLGQVAQKASTVGKATKDAVTSSKTFKSLQGTMNSLLKMQSAAAKQSKKSGALQFLAQENEKEFQKEQMEFWQVLLQKLDSIEKKIDGMGLAGKEPKKGFLSKLLDLAMGILGISNALLFIRQLLPKILSSINALGRKIANLGRRAVGLPEKPTQPKPGEVKPGEKKPGDMKPMEEEGKPTEEVKPKTPAEITEEAKAREVKITEKITEIRAELEKVYDSLEKQRQGLERNTTELEKARTAGDTEAVKRLSEMERLYKEEISRLEKTVNETRTELKSAQEKLVQARDVTTQMEKAALEGEKGFFERLRDGFDKLINDISENIKKATAQLAERTASTPEAAKPTTPPPPPDAVGPKQPTTDATTKSVVDTTAPKTVTDTINTGKGFTDTAVTVDKLITEKAVDASAREAVFRDVMNAKSAFDSGATEYVSKETGIKYTAEMAKGVDNAGRPYIEKITADTTNIKTEFAPKVSQTTPTGTPTVAGESAKPTEAPKAAEPVKPVRPAALDVPTAPETTTGTTEAPRTTGVAEGAPKAPTAEAMTPAEPAKPAGTPKPTSNTASILERTGRFIRPGVAITPGEIGRNLKATGEGLKSVKGAGGAALGVGAFSALQLANRWLNGEDISQEDVARQLTTDAAITAGAAGVLAVLPGLGPAAGPLALVMGAYLGSEVLSSWRRTRNLEKEASKHEAEINRLSKSTDSQDRMDLLGYMQYLSDWSQMEDYRASNIPFFPSDPKDPTDRQRTAKMQNDWLSQHPLPNIEDYVKGGKKQEEAIKKQSFAMLSSKILNDIVTENVQKYEQGSPGIFGSMLEVFMPQSTEWSEQVRSSFASDLDGYFLNLPQSDIDLITEVAGEQEIAKEQIRQQFNVLDKSQFEEIRAAIDPEFAKQVQIRQNAEVGRGVGYNTGGYVPGPAHIKHDTVPAMLTPGEFVVRKDAVNSIGLSTLYAINEGVLPQAIGYSEGGLVAEPAIVIPNTEIYPQQYFEDSLKPQNSFDKQYNISIDETTGRVVTEATDPTSGLKYEVVGEEATIALVSNLEKLREAINENTLVFGDIQTTIPMPKNEDLLKMNKEDLTSYVKETLKATEEEKINEGIYVYEPSQEEVDARVAYEIALAEGNTKEAEMLLQEVKRKSVENEIRRDTEIKNAVNKLLKQIELIKTEAKAEESEVSVNQRRTEELLSQEVNAVAESVSAVAQIPVVQETTKAEVAELDPAERKKQQEIELSNLKDRSETSYIAWQKATEQLSEDINKIGLSDEDYQVRQKEVNDLFSFYEQENEKYTSLMEEIRKQRREEMGPVQVETRTAEEIMESVYRIMRNTPTGFEASMPPERMMLEPDIKTPNSSWFTMLASASQIYNNPSIVSDIQQISRTISNSAESGLYQTSNTQNVPRIAEPIMEWSSSKKPIMAALFEETFNRLETTMKENKNTPIVVNNSPTTISGGGGGGSGDFASVQNSPRYTRVESDTIALLTATYSRGAVV
jgi:hypothetical protein